MDLVLSKGFPLFGNKGDLMALKIYVQSVVENKVENKIESYTVSVYMADDGFPTKQLSRKTVDVNADQTLAAMRIELGNKLISFWWKTKREEERRQNMIAQAQLVLDAIMVATTTTTTTSTTTTTTTT